MLASGNGSNAQRIAEYFSATDGVRIPLILSNNAKSYVHERAIKLGIPSAVFSRNALYNTDEVLNILIDHNPSLIVLAGFLWLIPEKIIARFPRRIINIHPALLPKYGGKGMFGHHVHEAVLASGDTESGITIHYVDLVYDRGDIIFQKRCPVFPTDTPDELARRVHELEYSYYPLVIDRLLHNQG